MLEGEEGKKHGNVQQQKTMTTCFENKKNLVQGVHNMHLFLQLRPRGLGTWLGVGEGGGGCCHMWDTDAHTEHLHRPAPQKSRAQRVHIQKHASPHNEQCG